MTGSGWSIFQFMTHPDNGGRVESDRAGPCPQREDRAAQADTNTIGDPNTIFSPLREIVVGARLSRPKVYHQTGSWTERAKKTWQEC
jgi:hypothetical protein